MSKFLVLTLLGFVLVHCGKTVDEASDAGQATDAGGSTTPTPIGDAATTDAFVDAHEGGRAPDAATPQVSCTVDDAGACDSIPPSVCVDPDTLVYFSAGACVNGSCAWKQTAMQCFQGYCTNGGCSPPTTK